jgi:hypothetical protein
VYYPKRSFMWSSAIYNWTGWPSMPSKYNLINFSLFFFLKRRDGRGSREILL